MFLNGFYYKTFLTIHLALQTDSQIGRVSLFS